MSDLVFAAIITLFGLALAGAGVAILVQEKETRPVIRALNVVVLVLLIAAYSCFGVSLFLPALNHNSGWVCLILGPLGLVGCVTPYVPWALVWFATPIVLFAIPLSQIASWRSHLAALCLQALGVGLAATLIFGRGIMQFWGSGGFATLQTLSMGYWLWLASLVIYSLATLALSVRQHLSTPSSALPTTGDAEPSRPAT